MSAVLGARQVAQVAEMDHVLFERLAPQIALPLASNHDLAAAKDSSSETASEAGRSDTKWHLLVIDDEHDIRKMLRSVLEFEGYRVGEAADGLQGLAQLRASARPLIVLLDYKMPRMNGEEMLHAVRADPDLAGRHAFIFVTANLPSFSPELLQLLSAATIPIIQKPYSIAKLLQEIERASARLEGTGTGPAS